jgi:cytochrome c-type biogenesis protein CcmH
MPFLLAALLVLSASAAVAVEPDEILSSSALEARARHISAGLRCLVCQNQSIDDSTAPLARDLRLLIRERLQAGSTDAEIEAFIVDRYGEFVLLKPRFTVHTALLWLAPFLLLVFGALILLSRRSRGEASLERALSPDEERALLRSRASEDH